ALERAVGLEHGIEMPDQQQVRSLVAVGRDEMPGTVELRAIQPLRLETERRERAPEQRPDLLHALEVEAAAVDVDRLLQELEGLRLPAVDDLDQAPLRIRQSRGGIREGRQQREREQCERRADARHEV